VRRAAGLVSALLLAIVALSIAVPVVLSANTSSQATPSEDRASHLVKCVDPGQCFAVSMCLRMGAAIKSLNASALPAHVREALSRVVAICRAAVREHGRLAIERALKVARIFAVVAPYVAKHVNRIELKELELKIIERAVAIRMAVIEKLERAAKALEKFNATKVVAQAVLSELSKAEKALKEALSLARNGSIVAAEKRVAYATQLIVRASMMMNSVVQRAKLFAVLTLHNLKHVAHPIVIACRALRAFNVSGDERLLLVAHRALSFAIAKLKAMGRALERMGFVNASKAMEVLVQNLTSVDREVLEALEKARAGSVSEAKSLAANALASLERVVKRVAIAIHRGVPALARQRASMRIEIAKCVADELGSLVLARELLSYVARHAHNISKKLEAELALVIIDSYIKHLAPIHAKAPWHPHPHPHPWRGHHHAVPKGIAPP